MEFTQQQLIDGELTHKLNEKLNINDEEEGEDEEEEEEEEDEEKICACSNVFKATNLQEEPDVSCFYCGHYICEECKDDSWHRVGYGEEEFFCNPCVLEAAALTIEILEDNKKKKAEEKKNED